MTIHRLNHAVLYVRDVAHSVAFYRDVLGFEVVMEMGTRASFLRADGSTNDHDLGLIAVGATARPSGAGRSSVGLYHLAWEVETLRDLDRLADRLGHVGALVGMTDHHTTKSLYGHDPDGLEFEIAWVVPADRLDAFALSHPRSTPLDIRATTERYGADTPGGYGISRPVVTH